MGLYIDIGHKDFNLYIKDLDFIQHLRDQARQEGKDFKEILKPVVKEYLDTFKKRGLI